MRSFRAFVLGYLHGEHAGIGMFCFANVYRLRPSTKWFPHVHAAGDVRRDLPPRVHEGRLFLHLRVDVLQRFRVRSGTNLHGRHVHCGYWELQ